MATTATTGDAIGWNYPTPSEGMGLYVHIPFCETKCPYCDFNTYSGIEALIPGYMEALRSEVDAWARGLGVLPLQSVFFGGGTPSYVPPDELAATLDTVRGSFDLPSSVEVTIEVNPGDVTRVKAESWLAAGVNRLSIGVQSFDDGLLRTLGRRHDAQMAEGALLAARAAGFANTSLDLIYALPGQSLEQWRHTLERAIRLEPSHVSLYSLQVETGTPFHRDVAAGRLTVPDDDLAAEMYELAMDLLEQASYRHYEISNWAKPGCESRHNLAYWLNRPYLGVGPGAHSSLFGQRFANMKSPRAYVRRLKTLPEFDGSADPIRWMRRNGPVDFHEVTSREIAISETMMMGLRLARGVSDSAFRTMFDVGLVDRFGNEIEDLRKLGLVEWSDGVLRLSRRGRLLGNEVFARFVHV